MHSPTRQTADSPGHDSFLDIVANMVGILIILVMVVGVRMKNSPLAAAIPGPNGQRGGGPEKELKGELEKELALEQSLRGDVLNAADEIDNLRRETVVHGRRRDVLAAAVASLEHHLQTGRRRMDARTQAVFDLKRSLSKSRGDLDRLANLRRQAETARSQPVVVESFPTPLSRTVNGRQAHFQLRGGLIAPVPFDELLAELKGQFRQKTWKLLDQRQITETLGPIRGFRLRYTLMRHDISPEMAMEIGRGGSMVRLERATFIPISGRLGEPVEAALAEGSDFRRALSSFHPGRSTVTIWTYADSFAGFRRVKRELYRLGYSVAGRPLPLGTPISASPDGTKSAAE